MSALQSHDGDSKRGYLPSLWTGCLGAQPGSDDFYAIHSTSALSGLSYQNSSSQSSHRSWDSPEQLGPTPWEAATEEQVHSRYHGLDPRLSGAVYLPGSQSGEKPISRPADAASFVPAQSFQGPGDGSQSARSQTEPYPAGYYASSVDGYLKTLESNVPPSTCTTLVDVPNPWKEQTTGQLGVEIASRNARKVSPSNDNAASGADKKEEPYTKLIYRAFLSSPRRALTLHEIYQWFRDNTDKDKNDNKGWQNSVRYNLSKNEAFTKRDREWYLETWAVEGVQSTTRYKGNQRRSATSQSRIAARVYRGYSSHHHHHHHHSAVSSRKGPAAVAANAAATNLSAADIKVERARTDSVTSSTPSYAMLSALPPTGVSEMQAIAFPQHSGRLMLHLGLGLKDATGVCEIQATAFIDEQPDLGLEQYAFSETTMASPVPLQPYPTTALQLHSLLGSPSRYIPNSHLHNVNPY